MGTRPIIEALAQWPADRFPPDFASYWEHRFHGYPAETVADAINALKLEQDPYLPTCQMVVDMLREWGVVAVSSVTSVAAEFTREQLRKSREEGERIAARHDEDNEVCDSVSVAEFNELAAEVLAGLPADVRPAFERPIPDSRREAWGDRPLGRFQSIRSVVADRIRAKRGGADAHAAQAVAG